MASIYPRGNSWYLNWRDAAGQHRESLGQVTKRQAEDRRVEKEYELSKGILSIRLVRPTFADFSLQYLVWYHAEYPATAHEMTRIITRTLVPMFGHLEIDKIGRQEAEALKSRNRHVRNDVDGVLISSTVPLKAETINKDLRTLKAMLNRAVEWEIIDKSAIKAVKARKSVNSKPIDFYSLKQLSMLYQTPSVDSWKLMVNTGLRRGEALQLRRKHVFPDHIHILSEDGARTKSGKWREVPLSDGAREALESLPGSDYVFPQMAPESLSRLFKRQATSQNLDGNLHILRHTFCSHLVMQGKPLRTVQMLAGHANYVTTERYAHLAPDHLAAAMKGFSL